MEEMLIEYLDCGKEYNFIDLRTPLEYSEGTIGKSFNIPIFTNEERVEIGTVYKQESVEKAKKLAILAVSKKLPEIYEQIIDLYHENKNIVLFCARGGMRSQTFGSLLNAMGYPVKVLDGGYKSYRNAVISQIDLLSNQMEYIVVHGNTGVGKTKVLHELMSLGAQVLDIEGLARHRGSLLGKVGISEEITQKQFEHELYECLRDFVPGRVFVEAESRRLGMINVPQVVMDGLKKSCYHVNTNAGLEIRIDNILEDYVIDEAAVEEMIGILPKFSRFISVEKTNELAEQLREGNFRDVARFLMVNHYDPKYEHQKYEFDFALDTEDISKASNALYDRYVKGRI